MGCGEVDGSYREQLYNPSMNTTDRLKAELYHTDFIMHIGDMSYAQGYGAIVRNTKCYMLRLAVKILNFIFTIIGILTNSLC